MIKIILACCILCCCGLIRSLWLISLSQFLIFYSILFISASMLESIDSSLLAKILPNNNSNNNFNKFVNPGLTIILTTTTGRFMGSLLVSIFGMYGFESIQNITFIFLIVLYAVAYVFVISFYDDLRVKAICRIIKKNL